MIRLIFEGSKTNTWKLVHVSGTLNGITADDLEQLIRQSKYHIELKENTE